MSVLFLLALLLYAASSLCFAAALWGRRESALRLARWVLLGALTVHLFYIGGLCQRHLNPLRDVQGALSFSGWLLGAGYLVATWRSRLALIGVFLAPAALSLLIISRLIPSPGSSVAVDGSLRLLGELHIALSAIGVAIFGLAAAVAMLYLMQEAALKNRRIGSLIRRTPSLKSLDEAGRKLILAGFPIFTLALVSGMIWVARLPNKGGLRLEHIISAVTWLVFAGLILTRVTIGLRGRKAALITLLGFSAILAVLFVYMYRRLWGG